MTIYSDALLINVATVRRLAWIVRHAVFVVIVVMVQMILEYLIGVSDDEKKKPRGDDIM